MANKKKAAKTYADIMKDEFENETTIEWHGMPIKITKTIGYKDTQEIIASVVDACFTSDGEYNPGAYDIALYACILDKYSDAAIPEGAEEAVRLVYGTDLMDVINGEINADQVMDIKDAIDNKIDSMLHTNAVAVNAGITKILEAIEQVSGVFGELFDGVGKEDIENVMKALADGKIDEEKLMKAYIDSKK